MGPLLTWWNVGIWGSWIFGGFCTREALALWWRGCPWDTFSRFFWDLQERFVWASFGAVILFAVLASHLLRLKRVQEGDQPTVGQQVSAAKVARAEKVLLKHQPRVAGVT